MAAAAETKASSDMQAAVEHIDKVVGDGKHVAAALEFFKTADGKIAGEERVAFVKGVLGLLQPKLGNTNIVTLTAQLLVHTGLVQDRIKPLIVQSLLTDGTFDGLATFLSITRSTFGADPLGVFEALGKGIVARAKGDGAVELAVDAYMHALSSALTLVFQVQAAQASSSSSAAAAAAPQQSLDQDFNDMVDMGDEDAVKRFDAETSAKLSGKALAMGGFSLRADASEYVPAAPAEEEPFEVDELEVQIAQLEANLTAAGNPRAAIDAAIADLVQNWAS